MYIVPWEEPCKQTVVTLAGRPEDSGVTLLYPALLYEALNRVLNRTTTIAIIVNYPSFSCRLTHTHTRTAI